MSAVPPQAVDAATAVFLRGGTVRDMLEAAAPWMAAPHPGMTADVYVYRVTGPGGEPLDLPRRLLPHRNFMSRTAAYRRAAVLRDQHGVEAGVRRSLPVQFPAPGEDGAGRPRTGPSTTGAVPGGSGTPPGGSEPAETATAP